MRTTKYRESNASALDDPTLRAGNPVKKILLKLNIPYHKYNILYCKTALTELEEIDNPDVNVLKSFEIKFPAIVYDDALKLDSDFSSKPEQNSELINDIKLENKASLPEYMTLPPRNERQAWLRDITKRLQMQHTDAKGQVVFTSSA
ncbi:hypothetical protein Tco_1351419 [Tanacetum coccineum]